MSDLRERSRGNGEHAAVNVELPKVHLRVNGAKVLPISGESWDHVNPVTGEVDATVPWRTPPRLTMPSSTRMRRLTSDGALPQLTGENCC